MNDIYEKFMKIAIEEAKESLKKGNNGFGAVIVKGDTILARTHDKEESDADPTSHAEINAIRLASQKYGRNFDDCILFSTHEPCPMCATAIIWSGITALVYGYSITEAIKEGRRRIDLTCKELFERAKSDITIHDGIMHDQCAILYRQDVRDEIKRLRGADEHDLESLMKHLLIKRTGWYKMNANKLDIDLNDLLLSGYKVLIKKLGIEPEEATVIHKSEEKIVFHSVNFCPTLEACKILDLDTRKICRAVNEKPTDALVKQLSDKLEFKRNYDKLRPYCDYCEEMIIKR